MADGDDAGAAAAGVDSALALDLPDFLLFLVYHIKLVGLPAQ